MSRGKSKKRKSTARQGHPARRRPVQHQVAHQVPARQNSAKRSQIHDLPLAGVALLSACICMLLVDAASWVVPAAASAWAVCALLPLLAARGSKVSPLVWLNTLLLVAAIFVAMPNEQTTTTSSTSAQPAASSAIPQPTASSSASAPAVTIKR